MGKNKIVFLFHCKLNKCCMIMKAFTEFHFSYCPLIYMLHFRTLKNKSYWSRVATLRITCSCYNLFFLKFQILFIWNLKNCVYNLKNWIKFEKLCAKLFWSIMNVFKACVRYFHQFFFHQMLALQKLWKMLFISS